MNLGYRFLHRLFYIIYKVFFSARSYNVENVPQNNGLIIAANHLSNWDPMLISCFLKRLVGYMAKQELFNVLGLGMALKNLYSFPVRRGAFDKTAIKTAIIRLKSGECMGVFPEGHRSKNGKMQQAANGVALIAAKTQVPVIPTAVINTNKIFKKGSFFPALKVIYGQPLYYTDDKVDKVRLQEFTDKIMEQIQNLINSDKT